jgi:hypothetical protein
MYAPLVEKLKKIEDPSITEIFPVDCEIAALHHLFHVYAIYPSIVFSQGGVSNITERVWDIWQPQFKKCKELNR